MTGLPKRQGFSSRSFGALQVSPGKVHSRQGRERARLRYVVSNLLCARHGFFYQPLRFRWPAAVKRRPIKSDGNIDERPNIARLFKSPSCISRGRFAEIQLTCTVVSIHFLLGHETNDAGRQLIIGNLVKFLEKSRPLSISPSELALLACIANTRHRTEAGASLTR
jgi:hypothetical protein